MKLIFSPAATKALVMLPKKDGAAILAKLQLVARDPMGQHPWARRLTNQPGFRLRQGDWRAVYRLDHETDELVVDKIAKREEVYR
jgi:mRNA interferase RelE/StbE